MKPGMWSIALPILVASVAWASDPPRPADDDTWVLLEGKTSNQHSGSMADIKAARAQQRGDEALLYFRRGDRAWVIRDAATLDRVRAAWAATNELGKRIEAVGKKLAPIGARQGAVGEKIGPIGQKMGGVGLRLGRRRLDDGERARLEKELRRLQAEMEPLTAEMEALSKSMQPYSDELARLGAGMERLVARARAGTTATVDDKPPRALAAPA